MTAMTTSATVRTPGRFRARGAVHAPDASAADLIASDDGPSPGGCVLPDGLAVAVTLSRSESTVRVVSPEGVPSDLQETLPPVDGCQSGAMGARNAPRRGGTST